MDMNMTQPTHATYGRSAVQDDTKRSVKNALPYYKRYPRDLIEGTLGMPFIERMTYCYLLDLLYLHCGKLTDDGRYISGQMSVSVRKWRSIRAALLGMGKIQVVDGYLTNTRVTSEVENQRKFQDKQAENRIKTNKNKGMAEPSSNRGATNQNQNQNHMTDDDDSAGKGEGNSIGSASGDPSFRERVLAAVGVDPVSGLTGRGGARLGTRADIAVFERWSMLGLSEADQLAVVAEVMGRKAGGPPVSLKYFDQAMEQLAGLKAAPALSPKAPVNSRTMAPDVSVPFDLAAFLAENPELDQ